MKKLWSILCAVFALTTVTLAQETPVTKFLGIPIEGTKYEMIQKLKAKGFTDAGPYSNADLIGEFNGRDVEVSVVTNNNKVYRIAVFDRYYISETDIKIRFNTLCRQFESNPKYGSLSVNEVQTITEDEDISYEINVHSKRYEAVFYQYLETRTKYPKYVGDYLLSEFSQEQLDNPTEEEKEKISNMTDEFFCVVTLDILTMENRSVWFMIDEEYGRYRILMFYDNTLNRSNGEDL